MVSGGKRKGAGRPKGKGKYQEPTSVVRLPTRMVGDVQKFVGAKGYKIPLYSGRVQAGYAEAIDDDIEDHIDFNTLLAQNPSETFLVRAAGSSMIDAGIRDGDMLVVDRSIPPVSGKIVIAAIGGQLTVKYFLIRKSKAYLQPANPAYLEIPVDKEEGVTIWGVVTSSIQMH